MMDPSIFGRREGRSIENDIAARNFDVPLKACAIAGKHGNEMLVLQASRPRRVRRDPDLIPLLDFGVVGKQAGAFVARLNAAPCFDHRATVENAFDAIRALSASGPGVCGVMRGPVAPSAVCANASKPAAY